MWQLVCALEILNPVAFPAPMSVANALVSHYNSGLLVRDVADSLRRVLTGFAIGSAIGTGTGILIALVPIVRFWMSPFVELLRPIPPLAWIPLALLWFGFGDPPAIFLVALGAFFPMVTAGISGVRSQGLTYLEHADLLGLSLYHKLFFVIIPQALPEILSGLKTALGFSWMIVVAAELIGAQSGLGYMIQTSRTLLQTELVVGGMVVIGIVGYVLSVAMRFVERWLTPWRRN